MTRLLAGLLFVCAASAQLPHIGDFDFYGNRKVTPAKILGTIHLESGDPLPGSRGDLEEQISNIPGVTLAQVQVVCCDGNRAALFIGIAERGEPTPLFHSPTSGTASLPPEILKAYNEYLPVVAQAAAKGGADESLVEGHVLMGDPVARGYQDRFIEFAKDHLAELRAELRGGPEPEERQAAAAIIGYAADKKAVVDDLLFAVQDADEGVRANALHALGAISVAAQKQPALGIRIAPAWIVQLLNSVELNDRVEATKTLLILTEGGNADVLGAVRERALNSLVEMARWPTLRYALPPFLLAGRLAGLSDDQVRQSWEKGDRDAVIGKLVDNGKKRRR